MRLYPNGAEVYNNLGIFYRKLGRHEYAISHYKKALDIDPHHAGAHYNLGLAYGGKGFFALAVDHFYRAGLFFLKQGDGEGVLKAFQGLKKTKSKEIEQTFFDKYSSELKQKKSELSK